MNLILGGGITGMTLLQQDKNAICITFNDHTAKSYNINGAIFDKGIHVINTLHKDMPSMNMIKRNAKIWHKDKMYNFPFQTNKNKIDNVVSSSKHYKNYLIKRFSDDAYDFHIPYAKKFWGVDLKDMSSEWCNTPQMPKGKGANEVFYYPQQNGIGEIWNKLYEQVKDRVIFDEIITINTRTKHVFTASGKKYKYDKLYNTIPLKEFGHLIKDICYDVYDATQKLEYTENYIYTFIFSDTIELADAQYHWCYSSENKTDWFRFSIPYSWNYYNKNLKLVQYECTKASSSIIKSLMQDKNVLIKTDYLKYSYCIPLLSDNHNLRIINDWCNKNNIFNRGRYGKHRNMWIHECLNETL